MANLRAAFTFAFDSNEEPRPVLVQLGGILASFSSEILQEYLNVNYVTFACDITEESERNQLKAEWEEIFDGEPLVISEWPMLIGIDRRISMKKSWTVLYSAHEDIDIDGLFNRLIHFKDEFDRNEGYFKSSFVQGIIASPELAISLSEYLSLNDAITVFSLDLIPILAYLRMKRPIVYPTLDFLCNTLHQIDPATIESLLLKAEQCPEIFTRSTSPAFRSIQTLIIENFQTRGQISGLKARFPCLTCFVLDFTQPLDLRRCCRIFSPLPSSTVQMQINCSTILCSHKHLRRLYIQPTVPDGNIRFFRLHLGESIARKCAQCVERCLLETLTDFLRIMKNLQEIELLIQPNDLEKFISINEWSSLAVECKNLVQITIKTRKAILIDAQMETKIHEIENHLLAIRETIKFVFLTFDHA